MRPAQDDRHVGKTFLDFLGDLNDAVEGHRCGTDADYAGFEPVNSRNEVLTGQVVRLRVHDIDFMFFFPHVGRDVIQAKRDLVSTGMANIGGISLQLENRGIYQ